MSSVHESHMNYGDWQIDLDPESTPQHILDLFIAKDDDDNGFLGHIIITPGDHLDPDEVDVLSLARYAGPLRSYEFSKDRKSIAGSGMVYWLGDRENPGPGRDETPLDLTGQTFTDALTNALAGSGVQPGNIIAETGTFSGPAFYLRTTRHKIEEICGDFDAEYLVTPQGRLDAGTPAALFPTFNAPIAFIKRGAAGVDPSAKQLPLANAQMAGDATRFATDKKLVHEQEDVVTIVGSATRATSKRDIHGNLVQITDIGTESEKDAANADSRAAALLALDAVPNRSSTLSTADFDVHGTVKLGDSVNVWDPEAGYVDMSNPIDIRGETYYPSRERVTGLSWPLAKNENGTTPGVFFRTTFDGVIHRITPYVKWEEGRSTDVEVSRFTRSLLSEPGRLLGPIVGPVVNPGSPPPVVDPPTAQGDERQLLITAPVTSGGNPLPLTVTKIDVFASTTSGFIADQSSYIGSIPVARGNINLGIAVKQAFPWPEEAQTYVRAAAVNGAGRGPASAEIAATADLITSAAILSLDAGKIAAGTITASLSIMSPTITGGIIQTAPSGQRVALEEGDVDRIKFYTGDADETQSGQVRSVVAGGAGSARYLNLISQAPWITGGVDAAQVASFSDSPDGTNVAGVELRTYTVATGAFNSMIRTGRAAVFAWVGSDVQRRLALTPAGGVTLAWGTDAEPMLRVTGTQTELRRALGSRTLLIDGVAAMLAYTPTERRLTVEIDTIAAVGSDNVTKFDVRDNQVNAWRNFALNDWGLRLRTAGDGNHYVAYNSAIDGPEIRGLARFWIRAFAADVSLYGNGGALEVGNYGNTAGRDVFASDFLPWSDARLKSDVSDLAASEIDGAFARLRPKRYTRDGKSEIGFIAQDAPSISRRQSTQDGKPTEALSLRTLVALNWGETALLRERVAALEASR